MKNKSIKIISIILVLNIFMVPLLNFIPGNQIKTKTVQASGELVDIRFFNAMVTMIGITAVGVTNMMSQNFSIPEVDMVALKDQFQTTLDADATKKTAWMTAQTEYLSGGVAKTMGAVELAKIGINDIYDEFKIYLSNKSLVVDNSSTDITNLTIDNMTITKTVDSVNGLTGYMNFMARVPRPWSFEYYGGQNIYVIKNLYTTVSPENGLHYTISGKYGSSNVFDLTVEWYDYRNIIANLNINGSLTNNQLQYLLTQLSSIGININDKYPSLSTTGLINGSLVNNNIINSTDTTRSIIPTIPWIDTTFPIGTVVTPAISAPYAGAVPIDIPIDPTDPTDPIDLPVEDDPTLIGTVAAILAGLTPIAGFLEYILAGQVSLIDAIEAGLTDVVDGIGDISGTLTGGITSSLTDIQSSISTLTAPASESINLDPVKNIPKVLFTKFPFSIPWDLYNVYDLMATDNRSPPEFSLGIPMTKSPALAVYGVGDINMNVKLENYEEIFGIIRVGELLLFVIGLIFATKKLIWG